MDNHGVVGTIREAKFGLLLEFLDVSFEQLLFLFAASIPDTAVVDEKALVHALKDALDFVFADVTVNAAGGDAGITDSLGLLGDALRIVDLSAVAEDVEDPLKLHFGDAIRELTDEDTRECSRSGSSGLVVLVIELNSFSGVRNERNVSDERTMEGVVAIVEILGSIGSDQHGVKTALEFDFSGTLVIVGERFLVRIVVGVIVVVVVVLVIHSSTTTHVVRVVSVRTLGRGRALLGGGDRGARRRNERGVVVVVVDIFTLMRSRSSGSVGRSGRGGGLVIVFAHFCIVWLFLSEKRRTRKGR